MGRKPFLERVWTVLPRRDPSRCWALKGSSARWCQRLEPNITPNACFYRTELIQDVIGDTEISPWSPDTAPAPTAGRRALRRGLWAVPQPLMNAPPPVNAVSASTRAGGLRVLGQSERRHWPLAQASG